MQPLGLDRHGALRPPAYGHAGWYSAGPEPGEPGAAVVAGHLDWATGPDVFARLAEVKPGHRVVVERADGSRVIFRVTGSQQFRQDAFPTRRVYGERDAPVIRLITCGGPYDATAGRYLENVVVFAELATG